MPDFDGVWDKLYSKFATREDVLKILHEMKCKDKDIQGIQSGTDGPVVTAGIDGIAHVKYENWIENNVLDGDRKPKKIYNESSNALTAAAAASIVKSLRSDIHHNTFKIQVIEDVDGEGHPLVPQIDYNTIYLTPEPIPSAHSNWIEWICVPTRRGASTKPFKWERLGDRTLDLDLVKGDVMLLNKEIKKLQNRLGKTSEMLANTILNKAVKPLKDLQDYLKSEEFTSYVMEILPRASLSNDGLMSAGNFALLNMMSVWIGSDYRMPGGGALGADYVLKLLKEIEFPEYEDLKEKYKSYIHLLPHD